MLKAFSPLLGDFQGRGVMVDGTELICDFKGEEIIPSLCYGFRIEVRNTENNTSVMDAYMLMNRSDTDDGLKISCVDARHRGPFQLNWIPNHQHGETEDSRLFQFDFSGKTGLPYRVQFDIMSAELFKIHLGVPRSDDIAKLLKSLWDCSFERKHMADILPLHAVPMKVAS